MRSVRIMEVLADLFRQLLTDSIDLGQGFYAGAFNFADSTKLPEELLSPLRAKAIYAVKRRLCPRFRSPLAMPSNCEPVRLIPDLLNQEQGRGVRG